jgi:alpha-D-xyloside xylohydrolase
MFGPKFLCCPVMQPVEKLKVYLPAGTKWKAVDGGDELEGGQTVEVNCPLEYMPVFARVQETQDVTKGDV